MSSFSQHETRALLIGSLLIGLTVASSLILTFWKDRKEESSLIIQEQTSVPQTLNFISLQEAQKIIQEDNTLVLDIRSDASYYSEHLLNSENISLDELSVWTSRLKEKGNLPSTILLIGYETQAISLSQATKYLESQLETTAIFTPTGGFEAWSSQSFPTINAGDPTNPIDQTKIQYISSQEALNRIASDPLLFILDTRSTEDYKKDYINTSQNIPLPLLEKKKADIPFGRTIFVYGENALESFQSGVRLFDMGFFDVLTLDSGYSELTSLTENSPRPSDQE